MKLHKAVDNTATSYLDEELLILENEFLRDELSFQEDMRQLELMETVLKCIEEEGTVSKSLEIMFGETIVNKDMFKIELKTVISDVSNELFNRQTEKAKTESLNKLFKSYIQKLKSMKVSDFAGTKFPLEPVMSKRIIKAVNAIHDIEDMDFGIDDLNDVTIEKLEKILEKYKRAIRKASDEIPEYAREDVVVKSAEELIKFIRDFIDLFSDTAEDMRSGYMKIYKNILTNNTDDQVKKRLERIVSENHRFQRICARLIMSFAKTVMSLAKPKDYYREFAKSN